MSTQHTERAAAAVEKCIRELQVRLAELHAAHPIKKMQLAPLVVATFLEQQQHQAQLNQSVIGELGALGRRLEQLALLQGAAFATVDNAES